MFKIDNHILLASPSLVCFWDFSSINPLISKSRYPYRLRKEGIDDQADQSVRKTLHIKEGEYYFIPRAECEALNIYGEKAEVTVLAWVKREKKSFVQCEAIAGMWNETEKKRQYCLFLNLRLFDSADQVCGHISGVGGPTPNQKWCIDAAIGENEVKYGEWSFVAFTYDGKEIRSYLNGKFDERQDRNPYPYQDGIFDAGENGSDFTVGAVHRLGEMGNDFVGEIAGLAVFSKALSPFEIMNIHLNSN
ncbi:LamG-like jellyroll fold domain-containing protein [uncultured Pedobacter sp.]|uniref:LamG-like jellyroll fold domain-containing protein n=1 Tax=uncultured Pedobacter sp. TaxID=246139 RepID=UPI00262AC900|nr:LamG-like jellyroll fold domain-containing protein [uncultured Pedobacter sp.]